MSLVTDILRNNRTFAVVGVSQDPARYGHEIFETLLAKGYRALPVNPKYEQVDGYPCYPSLEALPEKPDVVVAVVPPAVTEKTVEAAARLGVGTVWMPRGRGPTGRWNCASRPASPKSTTSVWCSPCVR